MPIKVDIKVGSSKSKSSGTATGEESRLIEQEDRNNFRIWNDDDLKKAVGKYFGKEPDHASLRDNELFQRYNWTPVKAVLKPTRVEVVSWGSTPVVVADAEKTNYHSNPADYTFKITHNINNTAHSSWNSQSKIGFGVSIKTNLILGETTGSMNFDHTWGEAGGTSKSETIGTEASITVKLNKNQTARAYLSSDLVSAKYRITYEVELTGSVAVDYIDTYKDHHFWSLPIKEILKANGIDLIKTVYEDIDIKFHSKSQLKLSEPNKKVNQSSFNAFNFQPDTSHLDVGNSFWF